MNSTMEIASTEFRTNTATILRIEPWIDPVIDTLGHDPRSLYVETFWLPTLGPTSLLLLRHLAGRFEKEPTGFAMSLAETARALGLGERIGSASPLMRSLERLVQFGVASTNGNGIYSVRLKVSPVNRRHVRRLPDSLATIHAAWCEEVLAEPMLEAVRRRARKIAFTHFELGRDLGEVEHILAAAGTHPSICRESAEWAHARHAAADKELAQNHVPGLSDEVADSGALAPVVELRRLGSAPRPVPQAAEVYPATAA